MYFSKSLGKSIERIEPFSLAALAKSKGKTSLKSEATPQLFEAGQEVKLKKLYPEIYNEIKGKLKYKKYFSAFIVIGSSWNIEDECWYYMIRYKLQVFAWVTEDQIKKASKQTVIAEGSPEERYRFRTAKSRTTWVPEQQPLDACLDKKLQQDYMDRMKAGSADVELRARLARRK